jgi:hypothetical protein
MSARSARLNSSFHGILGCVLRRRSTRRSGVRHAGFAFGALFVVLAHARAPILYSQGGYQSPVSAAADDLLLIPGRGFSRGDTVVYEVIGEGQTPSVQSLIRPSASNFERGFAGVVSYQNVPDSITVRMPRVISAARIYSLRVVTSAGEWSNGILVNDPRPLWISPSRISQIARGGRSQRYLKIIGRNLRTAADTKTYVKLIGPEIVAAVSIPDIHASQTLLRSVVTISLPARLAPGLYAVHLSRDGAHWQAVAGQRLEVTRARSTAEFSLAADSFGSCRPDDGEDDTACLVAAIKAAQIAGGGTVVFPPGVWDIANAATPGVTAGDGVVVPQGVDLRGAGPTLTTLRRSASWNSGSTNALLSLQGQNEVSGFRFQDTRIYTSDDPPSPFVQLGVVWYRRETRGPESVDDVRVFDNVFERPRIAIVAGGLPIRRLTVTNNVFGAFLTALSLGGDRSNVAQLFQLEDSVISRNTFKPGSYRDLAGQGTMATVIGAASRVDFSNNTADGAATDYLYEPGDARGWRAGFFWHMNNSLEMMLIAQNTATCTGDKAGDGEAIALDNNANTFALDRARRVLDAAGRSVTIDGPLQPKQFDQRVDIAHYYVGHWLQVVEGPGLGQSRKIESYVIDPTINKVVFRVTPRWDVVPVAGSSKIAVGREFWQVYVLDNLVDHRRPLCQKSNATKQAGGRIAVWAQTSDSLVAGNRQYDTDGIIAQQTYAGADVHCPACVPGMMLQSFLDIRENLIDGEYSWNSDCSQSGITIAHSASPTPDAPPPVLSYGVTIAHNNIIHADGFTGGAITVPAMWFHGPPPHRWPLVNNLLIFHNSISEVTGPPAKRECENQAPRRLGINIGDSGLVWRSVLYGNRCERVKDWLVDGGIDTVRVCPAAAGTQSCECSGTVQQK